MESAVCSALGKVGACQEGPDHGRQAAEEGMSRPEGQSLGKTYGCVRQLLSHHWQCCDFLLVFQFMNEFLLCLEVETLKKFSGALSD